MNTIKTALLWALIFTASILFAQNRNTIGIPYTNQLSQPSQSSIKIKSTFKNKSLNFNNVRALTELNDSLKGEAYPWISGDGLRLYYIQADSNFNSSLMFTSRPNLSSPFGASTPVLFNGAVPSFGYWLSDDELEIYYHIPSIGLFYAARNNTQFAFSTISQIFANGVLPFVFLSGVSLDSSQTSLFVFISPSQGTYRIQQYSRINTNTFNYVRDINPPSPFFPGPGQISNNGLSYFYSAYLDSITQLDSRLCMMTRASLVDTFDLNTFCFLPSINDTTVFNGMPTVSDNNDWIVFARGTSGFLSNDLYIASRSTVTSIEENASTGDNSLFSIYPNPASDRLNIKINDALVSEKANARIKLFDYKGKLVLDHRYSNELDLSELSKGLYVIQMLIDDNSYSKKFIVD